MTDSDLSAPETVEAVVRSQLAKALGGKRGMAEAAVPTIAFTVVFVLSSQLRLAVVLSVAIALVLLVVRLVGRSSVQFVVNSLVGIGIGALFAWRSTQGGGDAGDAALAYFLPGILYNAGYAAAMALSALVGWPVVGFMIGGVTGEPTAWHADRQVVRLCSTLTWLLVVPCVVRVAVELPLYLAGSNDVYDTGAMVAALGGAKIALGWPLQVAALAVMVWVLARNRTPLRAGADPA